MTFFSVEKIRALNLNSGISNINTDQVSVFVHSSIMTSEMEQAIENLMDQQAVVASYKQEKLKCVISIDSPREGWLYTVKCESSPSTDP